MSDLQNDKLYFDVADLIRLPRLDAPAALGLGRKLTAAAPGRMPERAQKALATLAAALDELSVVWAERRRVSRSFDPRPIDDMADTAWRALHDRMAAYALLPPELYPLAARATQLCASLFPTGLAFLGADYQTQWAESERRLQELRKNNLERLVETIAGKEFLDEVRRTHALYGEVIGATAGTGPGQGAPLPPLSGPLRATGRAMGAYFLQLAAIHDDEFSDEATRAAVRVALAPLMAHREAAARGADAMLRAGDAGEEATLDADEETTLVGSDEET